MSAELTVAIQAALAASQGLGWDTVNMLAGGVWLTAEEVEQARPILARAVAHLGPLAVKYRGSTIQPLRDDLRALLASLSAPAPDAFRGTTPKESA